MSKPVPPWQDFFDTPSLRRKLEQSAWHASSFSLYLRSRQRLSDAIPAPLDTFGSLFFSSPYMPVIFQGDGAIFARHERACFHLDCPTAPPLEMGGTSLCMHPKPREEQ